VRLDKGAARSGSSCPPTGAQRRLDLLDQIVLGCNLQALVVVTAGEAWTEPSRRNDDEWEINADTSETI